MDEINVLLERALVLFSHRRHPEAEAELRRLLALDSEFPLGHIYLGLVLSAQEKMDEARREAELGVHLAPDLPFAHFVLAAILHDMDKLRESQAALDQSLLLDPSDEESWALQASLYLNREKWAAALEAANRALTLEPEHVEAANLRARAQIKLGQKIASTHTLDGALGRNPENAVTHANMGWVLLEGGQHEKAMEHFREALRLNPMLEWARTGILESMKARNPLYRLLLRYFFWMSRLDGRTRWLIVLGLWFGSRYTYVLGALGTPVLIAYTIFVYLTWTAPTILNLLLRLDRFGRLVLSEREIRASNLVGGLLAVAGLAVVNIFRSPSSFWVILAWVAALLVIPVSAAFASDKRLTWWLAGLLALLGIGTLFVPFVVVGVGSTLFTAFIWGILLFSLYANAQGGA